MAPPPGVWLAPEGGKSEPLGTNDKVITSPRIVPNEESPQWSSWSEVPKDPSEVARKGRWFVEVFSGTARLTNEVKAKGIPCLPPIDVTICEAVPVPFDILDDNNWSLFMQLIFFGAIVFAHFGTPCNSYSAARKDDGGPPPLRSLEHPDGLPSLKDTDACIVFMGNLFKERTCEACIAIIDLGGDFSIENPLHSLLWMTPSVRSLVWCARAWIVDFDQCAFGAPSKKPTRLVISDQRMQAPLQHEILKGRVWSDQFQRVVYRTKLAQVYPWDLCANMADGIAAIWNQPFDHLSPSFDLKSLDMRKRAVGQAIPWKTHKQQRTAIAATAAGYQLKRGAMKPLIDIETDPGEAIRWALQIPHPFSVAEPLDSALTHAINAVALHADETVQKRQRLLQEWAAKAQSCLVQSDQILQQIDDRALRLLLRGVPDGHSAQLGTTCNIVLYQAFAQAVQSPDMSLASDILRGFPIVGRILPSKRWPPYDKEQTIVSLEELHSRAWAIRRKIVQRVRGVQDLGSNP